MTTEVSPARYRRLVSNNKLVGETCSIGGEKIMPARDLCPEHESPVKTPYSDLPRGKGLYELNRTLISDSTDQQPQPADNSFPICIAEDLLKDSVLLG